MTPSSSPLPGIGLVSLHWLSISDFYLVRATWALRAVSRVAGPGLKEARCLHNTHP